MKKVCLFSCLVLAAAPALAQSNVSSVLDGMGTRSSGGSYSAVSAGAQPGGISVSSAGDMVNYAGFLNTFSMKPGLDTDNDGLHDEVDADNDNDALTDLAEVEGTSFSPQTASAVNVADTDGDGHTDGEESVAGTDPTDSAAGLRILSIQRENGTNRVAWLARSGKDYHVLRSGDADALQASVVSTNTEVGGVGAWLVRTNSFEDTAGSDDLKYAVEALPTP